MATEIETEPLISRPESHVVCFFLPLPEPLGLPDGYYLTLNGPPDSVPDDLVGVDPAVYWPSFDRSAHAAAYVSIMIHQVPTTLTRAFPGIELSFRAAEIANGRRLPNPRWEALPVGQSTVIAMYTLVPKELVVALGATPTLTHVFDACIDKFRREVEGMMTLATGQHLTPLTRQMLPPWIMLALRPAQLRDGWTFHPYHLGTGLRRFLTPPPIPPSELDRFHRLGPSGEDADVTFTFAQVRHEAVLALEERGDTRSVIVNVATACEIHLDNLLISLLWEEGLGATKASELIRTSSLVGRSKDQFHRRIGGPWDRNEVGTWREAVVKVRNNVVHAGLRPSESEARRAIDALEDLVSFTTSRLVASAGRFPKTRLLLAGEEQLAGYRGHAQRLREPNPDLDAMRQQFLAFRAKVAKGLVA